MRQSEIRHATGTRLIRPYRQTPRPGGHMQRRPILRGSAADPPRVSRQVSPSRRPIRFGVAADPSRHSFRSFASFRSFRSFLTRKTSRTSRTSGTSRIVRLTRRHPSRPRSPGRPSCPFPFGVPEGAAAGRARGCRVPCTQPRVLGAAPPPFLSPTRHSLFLLQPLSLSTLAADTPRRSRRVSHGGV